jgi:putative ABC transport system permease protein
MGMWNFQAVARLAPGATRGSAQEEVDAFLSRMLQQYPDANQSRRLFLLPLQDFVVGDRARPILVLLGAVSFVLLIACANVANLMLMRFANRRRELALRAALGAGRLRIIRQLLAESTLLWLLGAGAGLWIAYWGMDLFRSMVPVDIPRREELGIDWRVLTFTGLLSLLSATLFGLIPALPASKIDLNAQLKEGAGLRSAGTGRQTLRGVLVAGEVALAFILPDGTARTGAHGSRYGDRARWSSGTDPSTHQHALWRDTPRCRHIGTRCACLGHSGACGLLCPSVARDKGGSSRSPSL